MQRTWLHRHKITINEAYIIAAVLIIITDEYGKPESEN